jgi:hypothetical protein
MIDTSVKSAQYDISTPKLIPDTQHTILQEGIHNFTLSSVGEELFLEHPVNATKLTTIDIDTDSILIVDVNIFNKNNQTIISANGGTSLFRKVITEVNDSIFFEIKAADTTGVLTVAITSEELTTVNPGNNIIPLNSNDSSVNWMFKAQNVGFYNISVHELSGTVSFSARDWLYFFLESSPFQSNPSIILPLGLNPIIINVDPSAGLNSYNLTVNFHEPFQEVGFGPNISENINSSRDVVRYFTVPSNSIVHFTFKSPSGSLEIRDLNNIKIPGANEWSDFGTLPNLQNLNRSVIVLIRLVSDNYTLYISDLKQEAEVLTLGKQIDNSIILEGFAKLYTIKNATPGVFRAFWTFNTSSTPMIDPIFFSNVGLLPFMGYRGTNILRTHIKQSSDLHLLFIGKWLSLNHTLEIEQFDELQLENRESTVSRANYMRHSFDDHEWPITFGEIGKWPITFGEIGTYNIRLQGFTSAFIIKFLDSSLQLLQEIDQFATTIEGTLNVDDITEQYYIKVTSQRFVGFPPQDYNLTVGAIELLGSTSTTSSSLTSTTSISSISTTGTSSISTTGASTTSTGESSSSESTDNGSVVLLPMSIVSGVIFVIIVNLGEKKNKKNR